MIEKEEMAVPQALLPKMKDPGKFTTACTIGGVKILHALYDLESSINAMSLNKFKELKFWEIIPSNMTLTLVGSYVTHPLSMVQDVLVHVDILVFPADFVVIYTKVDSEGPVIHGRPFLATWKAKIDVEIGELVLKFNKERVVFNMNEWTPYMYDLDTCYQLEEKGIRVDKGMRTSELTGVRVSLTSDMP
ncbi:uncharacterized protein LOC127130551 [Lathyrus oleraceus]|uniref:uncharacterized protein LOC127130551 n=1 Tax=Pisum sativum TaxID=3888 RepID=UPI0021D2A926|nr:uncharacterized protein LOC127130551 [Pisum sativum]